MHPKIPHGIYKGSEGVHFQNVNVKINAKIPGCVTKVTNVQSDNVKRDSNVPDKVHNIT